MSSMIERVAEAIYEADVGKGWHLHSEFYLKAARAAIEALREPTEEMAVTGGSACKYVDDDGENGVNRANAYECYKAMIDEALK